MHRSTNQSELRGLEVKTISVNEAEQSAKIKSVKKQWRKTKCSWYEEKMWVLLRMNATTSENRAKERVCKAKRGKLARRVMEEEHKERDFMWISKYQQTKICRKRTTADRQNWGKRISFLVRSSITRVVVMALHRLRLSRVGISYICGGLAFTVIL